MKNSLLIIFLFFSFSIVAQEKGAILALQSNSFDFGRILEDDGVVQHKFLFTNTGSDPLLVTNVRTTCGCTVPSWTKDPVQPGKEGYVEIEFNPRNHPGTFHKTVQVQSSAQNSNMFLTISGTVIPPMKMENLPNKLGELNVKSNHINLGYLYKGETGIENMIIANNTSAIGNEKTTVYIKTNKNEWQTIENSTKALIAKKIIRLIEKEYQNSF